MYIPSFKLISQSMLKKSPENADGRTDGRTLPRHNTSHFSNGRIKTGDQGSSHISNTCKPIIRVQGIEMRYTLIQLYMSDIFPRKAVYILCLDWYFCFHKVRCVIHRGRPDDIAEFVANRFAQFAAVSCPLGLLLQNEPLWTAHTQAITSI